MIDIRNVSVSFGATTVLCDITLSIAERRVAIVGANGSGKSTFVRLLNGLVVPGAGRVLVDGLDTRTDGKTVRRKVGFVFQNPDNQIVMPLVEEDIAFGLKALRLPAEDLEQRIEAALGRFDLLGLRKKAAHHLSAGQKQLVAIAGVLAMQPAHIVFDEPTTLLDLRNKKRIVDAIHSLDQSTVVVSHDLDLLADFDRVIVLDKGSVVADDRPTVALPRYLALMT